MSRSSICLFNNRNFPAHPTPPLPIFGVYISNVAEIRSRSLEPAWLMFGVSAFDKEQRGTETVGLSFLLFCWNLSVPADYCRESRFPPCDRKLSKFTKILQIKEQPDNKLHNGHWLRIEMEYICVRIDLITSLKASWRSVCGRNRLAPVARALSTGPKQFPVFGHTTDMDAPGD